MWRRAMSDALRSREGTPPAASMGLCPPKQALAEIGACDRRALPPET